MTETLERDAPVGRPKAKKEEPQAENRRFPTLIRVSEDVAQLGRELSAMRNVSMAELVSDTLRPILQEQLEQEMRKRLKPRPK